MRKIKQLLVVLFVIVFSLCAISCKKNMDFPDTVSLNHSALNDSENHTSFVEKVPSDSGSEENENITNEKYLIDVSFVEPSYTKEQLIEMADIVLKGVVLQKDGELMTNPDGMRRDSKNRLVVNQQIATYSLGIEQVYKGECDTDKIVVKTSNGFGLSPELILYGEDEKNVLCTPLNRFELEIGKEYIFALAYSKGQIEEESGYYVVGGDRGCFMFDESTGDYFSEDATVGYNFCLETLSQDIASVEASY